MHYTQPGEIALTVPQVHPGDDILSAALKYAKAGWYVGALDLTAVEPKSPGNVLKGGWQHQTSRDPKQIAAWFSGTNYGLFLHVGRSGALVLDVDHPENFPEHLLHHLDNVPTQVTNPLLGKRHHLFLQPPGRRIGNSVGKLGAGWGDVRGVNGVIVVCPTPHPDGGKYEWEHGGVVPVLPAEIAELLPDAGDTVDAATDAQIRKFIDEHKGNTQPALLIAKHRQFTDKVAADESRHNTMVPILAGAMEEARSGLYPAKTALDRLLTTFSDAVTRDGSRTARQAKAEFHGIAAWAIGQANVADLDAVAGARADRMLDSQFGMLAPAEVARIKAERSEQPAVAPGAAVTKMSLHKLHKTFRKWLSDEYDTDAIDATLAAVAVECLDGDPLWLLVISGSGHAKTETVQSTSGTGARVTSSLTSEAALLSATPKKEQDNGATGGLLRELGDRGVLVIKDVTSILSMDRNLRGRVLAALREVYDGYWTREVGAAGGRSLQWSGRIAVIGAVTTAWDQAHAVIASMGDRFVLIRLDSTQGRLAAGRQAIRNTGSEAQMRAELAAAVDGVIAGMDTVGIKPTDDENATLLGAADLVTLARTAVERNYRGDVIDVHAPEAPTRFAKQLTQILRGAVAIGMDRADAMRLAIRCARDSMPPMRLAIIDYLAANPDRLPGHVRKALSRPRATVDRELQALYMLGVLDCVESAASDDSDDQWIRRSYRIADGIDHGAIRPPKKVPEKLLTTPNPNLREGETGS